MAPGIVLFDAMMRDACARHLPRVDFNGHSDFFARWATGQNARMTIRLYRNSLRGHGIDAVADSGDVEFAAAAERTEQRCRAQLSDHGARLIHPEGRHAIGNILEDFGGDAAETERHHRPE